MDEDKETITQLEQALAEAKRLKLSAISVLLEDVLYDLRYRYLQKRGKL